MRVATFHIEIIDPAANDLYADKGGSAQGDSGVDLLCPDDVIVPPGGFSLVGLGVRAWCEQGGRNAPHFVLPRSSFGKTPLIVLSGRPLPVLGTALDYTVQVTVSNTSDSDYKIARGTALFQLVAADLAPARFVVDSRPASAQLLLQFTKPAAAHMIAAAKGPQGLVYGTQTIHAFEDIAFAPNETKLVCLGMKACCETDQKETVAFFLDPHPDLRAGSYLAMKNVRGVIDAGYRGELMARIQNCNDKPYVVNKGDPIFDINCPSARISSVAHVGDEHPQFASGATARGAGGFGSTGAAGTSAAT